MKEKELTHDELMGMNHEDLARYAQELQHRCAELVGTSEDSRDRAAAEIARADRMLAAIKTTADTLCGIAGMLDAVEP